MMVGGGRSGREWWHDGGCNNSATTLTWQLGQHEDINCYNQVLRLLEKIEQVGQAQL